MLWIHPSVLAVTSNFYGDIKTSFIYNHYNATQNIPEVAFAGEEIQGDMSCRIGHLFSGNTVGFNTGLYIRNNNMNEKTDVLLQSFSLNYQGEKISWLVGKEKTEWGSGTFFHPTYYIEELDEYKDEIYFPLPQKVHIWQGNFNAYFNNALFQVALYVDDFIDNDFSIPDWTSFRTSLQMFKGEFEMKYQLATLHRDTNFVIGGVELLYTGVPAFLFTTAYNHETDLDFQNKEAKFLFGTHYIHSDVGFSFGPELFYHTCWQTGVFLSFSPISGILEPFTFSESVICEFENTSYASFSRIEQVINSIVSHTLNFYYYSGKKGALFTSVPNDWKIQYLFHLKK